MWTNLSSLALKGVVGLALLLPLSEPAIAAEPSLECRGADCAYSLSGSAAPLQFGQSRFRCNTIMGRGINDGASTGRVALHFDHCREQTTVFGFSCPQRAVRTEHSDTRILPGSDAEPRLMISDVRLSLSCTSLIRFEMEGYLVGHFQPGACNRRARAFPLRFVLYAHARQGPGPIYDVYVEHPGVDSSYVLRPLWRLEFSRPVKLTC